MILFWTELRTVSGVKAPQNRRGELEPCEGKNKKIYLVTKPKEV